LIKNVGLYVPGFRKLDFGVLPVGGVHDGGAAHLRDPLAVAVEAPAADLVRANHVLDELKQGSMLRSLFSAILTIFCETFCDYLENVAIKYLSLNGSLLSATSKFSPLFTRTCLQNSNNVTFKPNHKLTFPPQFRLRLTLKLKRLLQA
jgi:hypothetical protein